MRPRDPLADPEHLIRRVYAYVAYRIGDGPDAEDVTAEALERALRYRASYDAGKGGEVAWVIAIARRVIQSRAGGQTTVPFDDAFQPTEAFEDSILRRLAVRAAVARLGERDRELIGLRYGADLGAREIAGLMGMNTNAVEVALHRVVGKLRVELDGGETLLPGQVVQPVPD